MNKTVYVVRIEGVIQSEHGSPEDAGDAARGLELAGVKDVTWGTASYVYGQERTDATQD